MVEETLIEVEGSHDRATIASYFRQFAEGLDEEGEITFSTEENETSLTVPETAGFEVEIESDTEDDETEYEIEFEVEWSTEEEAAAEEQVLEITTGSGTESEQETMDEAVADDEAGMEQPNPPEGRSEADAAEDDEGTQAGEHESEEDRSA